MKIGDIYANDNFALSFEVYPPKTEKGLVPLFDCVESLSQFQPGFISCTYGAGGSTQDRTMEIVRAIKDRFGVTATSHFTCVGSTVDEIREWLSTAQELGVENIMALRGDPPQGEENFTAVKGGLSYANELVALIKSEFPSFGIGVAGYPETHQEAPDTKTDLTNLKRKVDAGADAIFTQLFYKNEDFFKFREACDAMGVEIPIIPGLLPVLSLAQIQRITKLCKACLPDELVSKLQQHAEDPDAQVDVGVEFAAKQCEELLKAGVPGIHFYVLNKFGPTARVLESVSGLLPAKTV